MGNGCIQPQPIFAALQLASERIINMHVRFPLNLNHPMKRSCLALSLIIAQVAIGKGRGKKAQLIRKTTDLINAERRGAFAAISQRPLARALLLPSGSAGIWALFQYFPRLLAG
jgi:hypothetical protein